MDGYNWPITADINEILREINLFNALIHLHCSAGQVYITYPFGQDPVEDQPLGTVYFYLFI